MTHEAMFTGLVVDEAGNALEVARVGDRACYVVIDEDFHRHIDAANVDRQVLRFLKDQVDSQRDVAVKGMLEMMGKDDIFTKAAVESSIDKMEDVVGQPIPEEARSLLGMLGFRIVVNIHGDVVDIELPAGGIDEGDL